MKVDLSQIINLILKPDTRDFERQLLIAAKNAMGTAVSSDSILANLEWQLRPLALRHSLTPDVADFYRLLSGEKAYDTHYREEKNKMTHERAIFAGGCFWCMVQPFEDREGILSVTSGYTGGHVDHPSYEQVCSHTTGHTEAVEIIFDNKKVSYSQLVELYWQLTDPTDAFGQFEDRGDNYRPVIFVENDSQRQLAEQSKAALQVSRKFDKPIVVTIEDAAPFWPAEEYHQDFYKKDPQRYKASSTLRHAFLAKQRLKEKFL